MAPEAADLLTNALALPVRQRASEVRSGSVTTEDWEAVKARLTQRWHRR